MVQKDAIEEKGKIMETKKAEIQPLLFIKVMTY